MKGLAQLALLESATNSGLVIVHVHAVEVVPVPYLQGTKCRSSHSNWARRRRVAVGGDVTIADGEALKGHRALVQQVEDGAE